MENGKPYKILSIDGGGIRGVIPALFLAALEEKTGAPLYKNFDLICGTSTGALIALAAASGVKIDRVLELYKTKGRKIFPSSFWGKEKFVSLFKNAALYDDAPLRRELRALYGGKTAADLKTAVLIPSTNLSLKKPMVFRNAERHFWNFLSTNKELRLTDMALATSAAPYFFKPKKIAAEYFWDGGLWANNPAMSGFIEAQKVTGGARTVHMLSVGTGSAQEGKLSYKELQTLGFVDPKMTVPVMLDIQALAVHGQVERLRRYSGGVYKRVDCAFNEPKTLDDASKANIAEMLAAAEHMTREHLPETVQIFF